MSTQEKNIRLSLQRVIDGIYTKEDIAVISEYLKSMEDIELFNEISKSVWEESIEIKEPDYQQKEHYKKEASALLRKIKYKRFSISTKQIIRVAASIAIVITVVLGIQEFQNRKELAQNEYIELNVKRGQTQQLTLADGTKLFLNAGSSLRYPATFSGKNRTVELNGEAYFEVAPDANKPFIIHTGNMDIKVLGTSFNIKSYNEDDRAIVSVNSGKVQVDLAESMMRLVANEQIVLDKKSGELQKNIISTNDAKGWMNGSLSFKNTTIDNVAKELMRIYNCKIIIKDSTAMNVLVSGAIESKSLDSVLKSIYYSTGIRYRKESDTIVLSLNYLVLKRAGDIVSHY